MNPNINLINPSRRLKSPKTLLDAFEMVVELAKDSELNEEFFSAVKPAIKYITRKLEISPIQAVMLSICIDRSEQSKIRLSEIAQFLGIGTISMLKHSIEIDGLVEKHYLKMSNRRDDRTYRVPSPVLKAMRFNMAFEYQEDSIATTQEFFDWFNKMAREKKNDNIEYDNLKSKTLEMLEDIKESVFVRALNRYKFYEDDLVLFIFMAHLFIEDNDDDIRFGDIEDLYDDEEIPSRIKRLLRSHQHELFETGLIENGNEDGMARPDSFKLTDKAKEELLSELSVQSIGKSQAGLISHESLVKKELIYNAEEGKSVSELFALLEVSWFKDVQNRLKDAGMRPGFCCIFYGAPGTGKTETVYQLAKNTGRNILQVDVDKIKSCWVGESEKNIKALFDRYRNICKSTDVAPILLFNEADAVLGTRMEGASRAEVIDEPEVETSSSEPSVKETDHSKDDNDNPLLTPYYKIWGIKTMKDMESSKRKQSVDKKINPITGKGMVSKLLMPFYKLFSDKPIRAGLKLGNRKHKESYPDPEETRVVSADGYSPTLTYTHSDFWIWIGPKYDKRGEIVSETPLVEMREVA